MVNKKKRPRAGRCWAKTFLPAWRRCDEINITPIDGVVSILRRRRAVAQGLIHPSLLWGRGPGCGHWDRETGMVRRFAWPGRPHGLDKDILPAPRGGHKHVAPDSRDVAF